eukprot:TRINITY_DN9006_c0_g3_i3.p2 TRINITY_DN9006_c0_g3~~TRINITY_DN9006_c0_g3_i3.p2  ORF type:complete len:192 (-),score=4.63 TRINITY_DN9006_c0_g3_i3:45-620(-)
MPSHPKSGHCSKFNIFYWVYKNTIVLFSLQQISHFFAFLNWKLQCYKILAFRIEHFAPGNYGAWKGTYPSPIIQLQMGAFNNQQPIFVLSSNNTNIDFKNIGSPQTKPQQQQLIHQIQTILLPQTSFNLQNTVEYIKKKKQDYGQKFLLAMFTNNIPCKNILLPTLEDFNIVKTGLKNFVGLEQYELQGFH